MQFVRWCAAERERVTDGNDDVRHEIRKWMPLHAIRNRNDCAEAKRRRARGRSDDGCEPAAAQELGAREEKFYTRFLCVGIFRGWMRTLEYIYQGRPNI